MNVKQLLQFYADGKRDFSGVDLSHANLMDSTLSGIDLSGANLSETILSPSQSQRCQFE